jgi:hypothetical protein
MASEDFIDLDQTPNNFPHTPLISSGSPLPEQWLGSICVGGSQRRPSTHLDSVSKAELNSQPRCMSQMGQTRRLGRGGVTTPVRCPSNTDPRCIRSVLIALRWRCFLGPERN